MKVIMFPGQGSQYKGMGKNLFKIYKNETANASDILGYNIEELCVSDPERKLGKTEFTQPALYVVNAFGYYEQEKTNRPDYFIGHSLGEYNALHAAGAFDFEVGLKLVQKRGALMAAASGGGMAAVLGLNIEAVKRKMEEGGYSAIDIANYNTPTQTVISGKLDAIQRIVKDFTEQGIKIIQLNVSAPFHSRYMKPAAEEFASFLKGFKFFPLNTKVISNVTARPYENDKISHLLSGQIAGSVQWMDTVRFLMGQGVTFYEEMGGSILTKMVNEIKGNCTPLKENNEIKTTAVVSQSTTTPSLVRDSIEVKVESDPVSNLSYNLGSKAFREDYGLKYAYLAGGMYRGIASGEMVVRMGKSGMLGFLGTGGMSLHEIEDTIKYIQKRLAKEEPYGMNLLNTLNDPSFEMKTVDLYLKYGIRNIEAAAFMNITPALVYFRLKGLRKAADGTIIDNHKIVGKVSRPEVAEEFMRPAPERIVKKLQEQGLVSAEQAALSKNVPMSYDICVEADSGGHTDGGVALVLLPSIQRLKQRIEAEFGYNKSIRIGLAGGIGTPQSVACAFIMGADFVLTGSINQCTVEAGTSESVKDLLQDIDVQDTEYAPAGDMFEIGARVQVLSKGVLFPARANKLYALYKQYEALEEIPEKTIQQLEKNYFKKSIAVVWEETKAYLRNKGEQNLLGQAEQNSKVRMALVFRWYFGYTTRLAMEGSDFDKVNYQVHTGPALGAFNQWVRGTELENWRNRHVDEIGIRIKSMQSKAR